MRTIFLIAAAAWIASAAAAQEPRGAFVEHQLPSAHSGDPLPCPVYLPPEVDPAIPAPILIFFPDRIERVEALREAWSQGRDLGLHSMILAAPLVASDEFCRESALANFGEIMRGLDSLYAIDPSRIFFLGLGPGSEFAHFAARCLPDKPSALCVDTPGGASDIDLLSFARADRADQFFYIRESDRTYAVNWSHLPVLRLPPVAEGSTVDWRALCDRLLATRPLPETGPARVHVRSDRLRFNSRAWTTILNIRRFIEIAEVDFQLLPGERIAEGSAHNVNVLSLDLGDRADRAVIDGQSIELAAAGPTVLEHDGRTWRRIEPPAVVVTRKGPERAGPLADAMLTPHVFVYGTAEDSDLPLREWAEASALAEENGWIDAAGTRRRPVVLSDREALADESLLQTVSLICFGGAADNAVSARVGGGNLPGRRAPVSGRPDSVHLALRPSPFAFNRYAVIAEPGGIEACHHPARIAWNADWVVYSARDAEPLRRGMFDGEWNPEEIPGHLYQPITR
jgi:hypothetical protein